jgi:hypothetical protein
MILSIFHLILKLFIFPILNIFIFISSFSDFLISAQGLNDPSSHYIEGRLGGRRIWWCPSGYGLNKKIFF